MGGVGQSVRVGACCTDAFGDLVDRMAQRKGLVSWLGNAQNFLVRRDANFLSLRLRTW